MEHVLPVLVNTVLNGLDAIAYGPLLSGHVNGIGLYLVSTAVSQAILPFYTSFPLGATACTMVESIPFMVSIRKVADGNVTTMLMGSMLLTLSTSCGFALLRILDMERAVHQFPRVVLLGMMAGVGLFLLHAAHNLNTKNMAVFNTGFVLAGIVVLLERRYRIPFLLPAATITVIIVFYAVCFFAKIDSEYLRRTGWLPRIVKLDPFFYYNQLSYDSIGVDKLLRMIPIALAGSAFNLLHVPINVPSLSRFSGLPFRMDNELLTHSVINLASALTAFTPTYMAYTNSILFLKSGCRHWGTALWLSASTVLLLLVFEWVVVWVPNLVAIFLISNLAIDLVIESVLMPWRVARGRESVSVILIMFIASQFGFIAGLLAGVLISLSLLYFDRQAGEVYRRQVPEILIVGAISDRVTEKFAKKYVYTTNLESHLLFTNSVRILDTLRCAPPDTLFHIIDFTNVVSCDLNVIEGLLCLLNDANDYNEIVLVNCEIKSLLVNTMRPIRNFPSLRHAEKYCEMRLLQRLSDVERRELDGQIEQARYMEQTLLWSSSREEVQKEAGEVISLDTPFLLHLRYGQATLHGDHDQVVFLESGSWILPTQRVEFTASTNGVLVDTSPLKHETDTIYTLYTT